MVQVHRCVLLYLELTEGYVVVVEGSQEQDVLARDDVVRREATDLWWRHTHALRNGVSRERGGAVIHGGARRQQHRARSHP